MADDRLERLIERYHAALHAVQTGITYTMQHDPSGASPKHLRVLIAKGICTEIEYMEALVIETESEQARYEAELSERFGTVVKLG